MPRKYIVYSCVFPNGKMYIGKTYDLTIRSAAHELAAMRGSEVCPKFYRALRKFGGRHTWEELGVYEFEDTALKAEAEYIRAYATQDDEYGYNVTAGGEGASGLSHTDRSKEMIGRAARERIVRDGHPMLGRTHSKESRSKMRLARMGTRHTEETKKKIREHNRGRMRAVVAKSLDSVECYVFDSIRSAAKVLGLKHQSIGRVLRGGRKSTGGYIFKEAY